MTGIDEGGKYKLGQGRQESLNDKGIDDQKQEECWIKCSFGFHI